MTGAVASKAWRDMSRDERISACRRLACLSSDEIGRVLGTSALTIQNFMRQYQIALVEKRSAAKERTDPTEGKDYACPSADYDGVFSAFLQERVDGRRIKTPADIQRAMTKAPDGFFNRRAPYNPYQRDIVRRLPRGRG